MITPQLNQLMIGWRRDLHQIPELGNELPQTVAYVCRVLDEYDITYQLLMDGNAVVATLPGQASGPCVALRGDMDGLAIVEQTGLDFASKNGRMHACGHDGHTAMALAAAVYFKQQPDFSGTVKVLFQPGEESPGGAKPMIEQGALDGVSAIFGLHLGNFEPEIPKGSFATRPGSHMAAPDTFEIRVIGQGGHASTPDKAVDPIMIGSHLVQAFQSLVARETSPVDPVVISVTQFLAGTAHNIIPNEARLVGTVRTVNPDTRQRIAKRMEQVAQAIAEGFRGQIRLDYQFTYPPLINHPAMAELALQAAAKLVGPDNAISSDSPMMAAEDFAYFLEQVPGCFMHLSNPLAVDGVTYPLHHAKFNFDEDYLSIGVNYLIRVALDFLATKKVG